MHLTLEEVRKTPLRRVIGIHHTNKHFIRQPVNLINTHHKAVGLNYSLRDREKKQL